MKSIIIFYDDEKSLYKNEKGFDGKSSIELSAEWAKKVGADKTVTLSKMNSVLELLEAMCKQAKDSSADYVIFAYNDFPFLNYELTNRLIDFHTKYHSEYTFVDGYSKGLAPELIHTGTLNILLELAKTTQTEEGQKKVSREAIYNLIKTDINSFEIETILADDDYRLLRFNFDCENKADYLSCVNLYKELCQKKLKVLEGNADEINKAAQNCASVLKTVPCYYNIQIADRCSGKCVYCPYPKQYKEKNKAEVFKAENFMSYEKASELIKKIADFSEEAVICLSLWGEAFNNPDVFNIIENILSYKGLSVFIETDGMLINDDVCSKLKASIQKKCEHVGKWAPVMLAVSMDAFSDAMYKKIRGAEGSLQDALNVVEKLNAVVPGNVYPQFVRMNENEEELEGFFRYWKEKSNASGGEFIIQKYDDFAGLLPSQKPADLSPIERNVCWHLRRDMNILTNGDVILCKEYVLDNVIGNVFTQSLKEIWEKTDSLLKEQIEGKINKKCGDCDEYYTFNF